MPPLDRQGDPGKFVRMKRNWIIIGLAAFILANVASVEAQRNRAELDKQVQDTIALFQRVDEDLKKLFDESPGYAVFPRVAKGGLGVGAARGTGQLLEGGKPVGEAGLTQVTVGLQLGGQVYAEVIFFETEETLNRFKEGNLEFSAQVSAVAAAEGASKNAKFEHGVLIFTLARAGLMYEASVGGQKFSFRPYPAAD